MLQDLQNKNQYINILNIKLKNSYSYSNSYLKYFSYNIINSIIPYIYNLLKFKVWLYFKYNYNKFFFIFNNRISN